MDGTDRIRSALRHSPDPEETEEDHGRRVERATPGVAELFRGLSRDGSHVILDLGPAVGAHLRLYGQFARQIRFADLLPRPPHGAQWKAALRTLPPHPRRPYDVVLAWNLLDQLGPRERPLLIERLDELTGEGARLYALADASEQPTTQPLRFALSGLDRVSQEAVGPAEPAERPLLPAEMERLLGPFEVTRAFTLRLGLREYVAVKGGG